MPIRVQWFKGRYIGLSLFYFGIMGLVQSVLFIPFGQYIMSIGSLYVLILLPLGVTLAMTYSTQILYEGYAQQYSRSRRKAKDLLFGMEKDIFKPIIIISVGFTIIFFIANSLLGTMESINAFVISENIAAIGVLIIATVLENQLVPKKR